MTLERAAADQQPMVLAQARIDGSIRSAHWLAAISTTHTATGGMHR